MRLKLLIFVSLCYGSIIAQVSDFKSIDFTRADNRAKRYNGHSLKNLPLLAYHLTQDLQTDVEKFRAIFSWVCQNIKGDPLQHNKVAKYRNKFKSDPSGYLIWNEEYKRSAFKKLVKRKKTMCTGYAYLIRELCYLANIECEIVDGFGRSADSNVLELEAANHSWNAVKLNNKWYLCDATWSSGFMVNNAFFQNYNDGYFLTEPILFSKNHIPLKRKWLLDDTLITSEFIASPLVYGETFKYKVVPMQPQELNLSASKNQNVSFKFKTLRDLSEHRISLVKYIGATERSLKIEDLKNEKGTLEFNYAFKQKGFQDVHLKIDDDIVATYTIEVCNN